MPDPERVVGMHFFNPPVLMKLVEVVAAERSSERALAATTEVAEAMGRTPIRARDTPGFVANRLARPFALESLRMLGDGVADAATIDRVVRLGGGFRMGPFELIDLIGLDVNLTIARSFFAQGGEPERWRPSPIQERLVEEGKLGRKSGEGYYSYGGATSRARASDPGAGDRGADARPRAAGQDRPRRERDPPPPLRPDRQRGRLRPRRRGRLAGDMETAMRLGLNWPLGPLEIAELIGAATPSSCWRSWSASRATLTPRRRCCARRPSGASSCATSPKRSSAAIRPRSRRSDAHPSGSSIAERTRRLIAIAHPKFRDELTASAVERGYLR